MSMLPYSICLAVACDLPYVQMMFQLITEAVVYLHKTHAIILDWFWIIMNNFDAPWGNWTCCGFWPNWYTAKIVKIAC